MKKQQIKKIAKIYAAVLIDNALGTGANAEIFTDEERELFSIEVDKIGKKLAKGFSDEIFQIVCLDDIVNYVKSQSDEKS